MFIKEKIIDWLKDYHKTTNLCFVVGVSGGIDSAVVSTLCALTGVKTHVVNIPILQNEKQVNLSTLHSDWLKNNFNNVKVHTIEMTDSFLQIKKSLNNYDTDLGWANTKSRIRMLTLYQIASHQKGLVVGTGNKIEDFGIGFFTKYGDGGVDISPIADLTKTEVRYLANELTVIQEIIDAPPTDGLWEDNRTDEDQIGATYEELEWAMKYYENNKFFYIHDLSELTEREKQVLFIFKEFNDKNKHKMKPIPIYKKNL